MHLLYDLLAELQLAILAEALHMHLHRAPQHKLLDDRRFYLSETLRPKTRARCGATTSCRCTRTTETWTLRFGTTRGVLLSLVHLEHIVRFSSSVVLQFCKHLKGHHNGGH